MITKEGKCEGCGQVKLVRCVEEGSMTVCDECAAYMGQAIVSYIKWAVVWFCFGAIAGMVFVKNFCPNHY